VDEYIDQMVTEYVKPAKVVIQSKTETGYRSVRDIGIVAMRKDRSFDIFPCYFSEMQIGIISNVWLVVKMPGGMKGIEIDREDNDKKRDNGEDISMAR